MRQFYDTFPTPAGDFSIAVDDNGAVLATAFGGIEELRRRFAPNELVRDAARVADAREEVKEYFAGDREEFSLRLAPTGTPFQHKVWAALVRIPIGETRTYGQLAAELGNPNASRSCMPPAPPIPRARTSMRRTTWSRARRV